MSTGSDPLAGFSAPTKAWFSSAFEAPTAAQAEAWGAIGAGKDVNWDLLNYHYYAPWQLLEGRLSQDFFAAVRSDTVGAFMASHRLARPELRRRKAELIVRLTVCWCAMREFFEEKVEPMMAEPMEIVSHFAPHFAWRGRIERTHAREAAGSEADIGTRAGGRERYTAT